MWGNLISLVEVVALLFGTFVCGGGGEEVGRELVRYLVFLFWKLWLAKVGIQTLGPMALSSVYFYCVLQPPPPPPAWLLISRVAVMWDIAVSIS